ncbi:MAG: hypothetical protein IPK39_15645 [Sulfuritalea sp.]|nr:hypothetical protein [Sulfuritalea sp.]
MDEQDHLRAAKPVQLREDIRAGPDGGPAAALDAENVKREGRAKRRAMPGSTSHRMARIHCRPLAGAEITDIRAYIAEDGVLEADARADCPDGKLLLPANQPKDGPCPRFSIARPAQHAVRPRCHLLRAAPPMASASFARYIRRATSMRCSIPARSGEVTWE